ncbi:MAG TPA: hypothetical protein VN932_02095 [Rhizomicrobium sp.]|nr:hypothetical protein [Rhizomicrobium sp.]
MKLALMLFVAWTALDLVAGKTVLKVFAPIAHGIWHTIAYAFMP